MFMLITIKGIAGRLAPASTGLVSLARGLVKAATNRRSVWQLSHADDRLLKDIGLTRSDILSALDAPFYTDPSGNLMEHAGLRAGDPDGSRHVRSDVSKLTSRPSGTKAASIARAA